MGLIVGAGGLNDSLGPGFFRVQGVLRSRAL